MEFVLEMDFYLWFSLDIGLTLHYTTRTIPLFRGFPVLVVGSYPRLFEFTSFVVTLRLTLGILLSESQMIQAF